MIRIALQTCLTIMALLISASASLAADCADDPNECTLKKLCEVATALDGGNTIWSTASGLSKHVALAQGLGMECGVTPIVDLCETDPSECKVSEICGKATTDNGGQISWDDSASAYVALAKEYGLSCDVVVEAKTTYGWQKCLATSPQVCSDTELCSRATNLFDSPKTWNEIKYASDYVKEAKKRGLTCGVSEVQTIPDKEHCSINPENCDDVDLCFSASGPLASGLTGAVGSRVWREGTDAAKEAKKRGLSCGVEAAVVKKTCSASNVDGCSKEALCERATYDKLSGIREWIAVNNKYVTEAKKRGLSCGVGEVQATSVEKECSQSSPEGCTDTQLCKLSIITKENAKVYWIGNTYAEPYVKEAKKRGLTCGVGIKATNFKKAFTSQSRLKRQQLQYALKKLGYYSYGVDGLWGKGTSSAFVKFVSGNGLKGKRESEVFSSLLSKVNVPSSFAAPKKAAPKKKATTSNYPKGWRPFSANPQYSFDQAEAICEPRAKSAGDAASDSAFSQSGSSFSCNSFGSMTNCRDTSGPSSAAEGFLTGMLRGIDRVTAKKRVMKSCMAQYGWKKQ